MNWRELIHELAGTWSAAKPFCHQANPTTLPLISNPSNIPVGLHSLGYSGSDVNDLARATLPQHRVTQLSPRQPIELEELQDLFTDAM